MQKYGISVICQDDTGDSTAALKKSLEKMQKKLAAMTLPATASEADKKALKAL